MAKKIILESEKVRLRPLSLADAPRFCAWLADPEVTNFLAIHGQKPPTLSEEHEYIRESQRSKSRVQFAIDTPEKEPIGTVSLMKIDPVNKNAELGIFIGNKKYWGQGCGTQACHLMVDYGFRMLKLHRIYLRYIAYNIRGAKAYKRVGFKIEGKMREHVWRGGRWHNEVIMSLLSNEYLQRNQKRYGRAITKN